MRKLTKCPECGKYHILREDKVFKLSLPIMAGIATVVFLLIEIFNIERNYDALIVFAIIVSSVFLVLSLIDYKETNFIEKACMDCGFKWE
ncbi:hypothetical protein A0256_13940 [Mucilaginibacter sp. PAMC 26640]|nr:hypothetical protein A0256_13940 [Mucilaginibacter sp. PAMC 26640]